MSALFKIQCVVSAFRPNHISSFLSHSSISIRAVFYKYSFIFRLFSGLHQNIWSLLQHPFTIGQLVPFYKDRYNFYRSSQLMSSTMWPAIWLTMITTTTTRLNDWSGWHSCTPTTHQERPGSTNDLIWFGWVHLQNHHSVEWMVTPNFTKISSNLMIQNMFSFYSSCGNHSCLHFTAYSKWNKTNVYIPRT